MSHIFVSYSRDDSACAYKIQCKLEAHGYKVWIDKSDIDAGDPFPQRIIEAIVEASAFVVLWSANSAKSTYVDAEIEEAVNQRMHRKMPIIPVWLDTTQLHSKLQSFNAMTVKDCDDRAIRTLIDKIPQDIKNELSRKFANHDLSKAFKVDDDVDDTSTLVTIPYLESWYCEATLIAEANTDVATHLAQDNPYIVLIPQFLGSTADSTVQQAFKSLKPTLEEQAFVCLHIKPKQAGTIVVNVEECGQTLDAINTTYEALLQLVGGNRGLATVKLCTPMLAALSASIMYRFDSFWHFQVYHFERQTTQYYLLFDSKNL
jgi:hypothetical protein